MPDTNGRTPHKIIAGFRIEHALRHLTTDPAASATTKMLAHGALYGNPDNPHDADYVTDRLHLLHDSLLDDGHPLAAEDGGYRWANASHKVHVDATVGHAISAIAARAGGSSYVRDGVATPEEVALDALNNHVHFPGEFRQTDDHHVAAREAAAELQKHIGAEDLKDSLDRHFTRSVDRGVTDPRVQESIRQAALKPATKSAKYARPTVRRPVHELIRGTRLAIQLKALAKHKDAAVSALAKRTLRDGDLNTLAILHDRLDEHDDPRLQREGEKYDYRGAARKLQIDRAVHPIIHRRASALAERVGDGSSSFLDHAISTVSNPGINLDFVTKRYGDDLRAIPDYHTEAHELAQAALSAVPDATNAELRGSLHRIRLAANDRLGRNPSVPEMKKSEWFRERLQKIKASARAPEPTPAYKTNDVMHQSETPEALAASRFKFGRRARYRRRAVADFVAAFRRLRSRNQQALRKTTEANQKKLKLEPAQTWDSVFDHPKGAVATLVQRVHTGDRERSRELAAWTLLHLNLPSVVHFTADDDGSDSLYRITTVGSGDRIRSVLDDHGIHQRVLVPHDRGYHVLVYSPDSAHEGQVASAARKLGGLVSAVKGRGELIGNGDGGPTGDEDSRRIAKSIITARLRKIQGQQPNASATAPATAAAVAGDRGAVAANANAGFTTAA